MCCTFINRTIEKKNGLHITKAQKVGYWTHILAVLTIIGEYVAKLNEKCHTDTPTAVHVKKEKKNERKSHLKHFYYVSGSKDQN